MKKMFFGIAALVMFFSLNSAAFAGGSGAKPCPPNMSCSENYMMPIAQTGAAPEKKEFSPEEIAARKAAIEKALERDNDKLVKRFVYGSETRVCIWSFPESELLDWLIKNPDVIIDRKEYTSPSYKVMKVSKYDGAVSSECTTMIVVHYHNKITKGGEKE